VWRWQDTDEEVCLFGVNAYVPFSIDHAALQQAGIDHEDTIRQSVREFVRLGLDCMRLHCWDRQISDREGNLVQNRHLDLLDRLVAECRSHGVYVVLTPIAWWNAPEPGGFSDLFSMQEMTTRPDAWVLQQTYLAQFLRHVNPYTGLSFAEDPAVVAIELINEPLYPTGTTDAAVTAYINALVSAVRGAGCAKPVFYNGWGERHGAAAAAADLDGVTFGWYPTGLVNGRVLTGNYLPLVRDYPDMRDPVLRSHAKMVYEFDAADVDSPCMYPAMARAFRAGGAQVANQFQYDLTPLAAVNSNWQTHYLNLFHTPGKALGFAIAARVFRETPREDWVPEYPESVRMGQARVSHEQGLAEYVSDTVLLYTGTTSTPVPLPERLERVWGRGRSEVARFDGTGAYFLDRVEPGVWRLQVFPDAVRVADAYTGGSGEKTRLLSVTHPFTVRLPDLGSDFSVRSLQAEGEPLTASEGVFACGPGDYLLVRNGLDHADTGLASAPVYPEWHPPEPERVAGCLDLPEHWREGYPLPVSITVAEPGVRSVALELRTTTEERWQPLMADLDRSDPYTFTAILPPESLPAGSYLFRALVASTDRTVVLPGNLVDSDDHGLRPFAVFRADTEPEPSAIQQSGVLGGKPSAVTAEFVRDQVEGVGDAWVRLSAPGFEPGRSAAGFRFAVGSAPEPGQTVDWVRVRARGGPETRAVEVGFVLTDGRAYGTVVPLAVTGTDWQVPVEGLIPLWGTEGGRPDFSQVREVSFVFGAWLFPDVAGDNHWVDMGDVVLGSRLEGIRVRVAATEEPVVLARGGTVQRVTGQEGAGVLTVPGLDSGTRAARISVDSFGPPPASVSCRMPVPLHVREWIDPGSCTAVVLTARSGQAATDCVELVLLERDGAPWGVNRVPLSRDWARVRIPLSAFRFFDHWHHPPGRGGPRDRLDVREIDAVNLCFGAWLFGDDADRPHAVEIQDVALE
jgi:hypothetical protein